MTENLLFVSAGDKTEFFKYWIDKERNYKIILCYYGDKPENPYKSYVDYAFQRKGSKFQNFYHLWNTKPEIRNFKNFFIIDDDIIIKTIGINRLFGILNKYNLWVLQPSFHPRSKLSHKITRKNPKFLLRYVNFIEVTAMMFSNYAMKKCMEVYDPILVGWGIDYLFLWHLNFRLTDKFAVVDRISCVNPKTDERDREISKLQKTNVRRQTWEKFRKKNNIFQWKHRTYKAIPLIQ